MFVRRGKNWNKTEIKEFQTVLKLSFQPKQNAPVVKRF